MNTRFWLIILLLGLAFGGIGGGGRAYGSAGGGGDMLMR